MVPGTVTALLLSCLCHHITVTSSVIVCNETHDIEYIAENLVVKYEVLGNYNATTNVTSGRLSGRLLLTNSGTRTIRGATQWQIFLSSIRDMDSTGNGTKLGASGLTVRHVNGVLHYMEPTADFVDLAPGKTLDVIFEASDWMVARTDVMPNWYVVQRDCPQTALTISSTTDSAALSFVVPFTRPEQWKRAPEDEYNPWTPQDRYAQNSVDESFQWKVIPTPVELSVSSSSGTVNVLTDGWVIVQPNDTQLLAEAQFLADSLHLSIVSADSAPIARTIHLFVSVVSASSSLEAYSVNVDAVSQLIAINGSSAAGVFYGIQTVISLANCDDGNLPTLNVTDWPRFAHRGLSVDVARNFHSDASHIKKLLDAMAMYKLNKLHMHLSDDEGWRLEIPGLAELTEIGGLRCHDLQEDKCIIPQLGSGPTSSTSGSGYYTVADYRDILAYAEQRHVKVIPEFDMPGHAHAAIAAMLSRYRQLNDSSYLLSDLGDTSAYRSVQGFTDNAINPCINSTYRFINHVVAELIEMHRGVQNLTVFHFGGDEVPHDAWTKSPACEQFKVDIAKPDATPADLKTFFVKKVSEICKQHGVNMACWEDGLYAGESIINKSLLATDETTANVWNNVWEWGSGRRTYDLANSQYKVILSHATHLYFDFPYEPDPEERGYYWATRYISLKKVFSFRPDSVYANMDVDRMGRPLNQTAICAQYGCPPLTQPDNIIGMQGQLWSETVRQSTELDYMIFPRLLGVAERAWHRADWEQSADTQAALDQDWQQFANVLAQQEMRRLDELSVKYRVPMPGARLSASNAVEVNCELPGLPLRFSIDGEQTWTDWLPDTQLILSYVQPNVTLAALSADGSRMSRPVSLVMAASEATDLTVHDTQWSIVLLCVTSLVIVCSL